MEKIRENQQLVNTIDAMLDTKAEKIEVFYTGSNSPVADWVVICEATNYTHVRAVADAVKQRIKDDNNLRPAGLEGHEQRRWVLLDYFDIIVHIMLPELREYYKLEDLFGEAEKFDITEENFEK